jgi:hypothetical protein
MDGRLPGLRLVIGGVLMAGCAKTAVRLRVAGGRRGDS